MTRRGFIVALLLATFSAAPLFAAAAAKEPKAKTITGKSACSHCNGGPTEAHAIMLIDSKGRRWVLINGPEGDGDAYRKAQEVRKEGKTMTATYMGQPTVKKDSKGKDYAEVTITSIKVES